MVAVENSKLTKDCNKAHGASHNVSCLNYCVFASSCLIVMCSLVCHVTKLSRWLLVIWIIWFTLSWINSHKMNWSPSLFVLWTFVTAKFKRLFCILELANVVHPNMFRSSSFYSRQHLCFKKEVTALQRTHYRLFSQSCFDEGNLKDKIDVGGHTAFKTNMWLIMQIIYTIFLSTYIRASCMHARLQWWWPYCDVSAFGPGMMRWCMGLLNWHGGVFT